MEYNDKDATISNEITNHFSCFNTAMALNKFVISSISITYRLPWIPSKTNAFSVEPILV